MLSSLFYPDISPIMILNAKDDEKGKRMTEQNTPKPRPLSPHLQVYSPQITSMTSIMHRLSGVALAIGLFFVTWALVALANGRESYEFFIAFCLSPIGQIMLAGWTLAFYYHMCTGIRHLIRDCGYLYENRDSVVTGWFVIIFAILFTGVTWGYIYMDWITGVLAS